MMDLRLRAYAPNGASLGYLPAPDDISLAIPLNDAPALTVGYAVMGPRADLLGKPLELAVEVSGDGGATWTEPDDCRFIYLRDGRDPIKTADAYAVEAPGYVWRLKKARVLDEGKAVEGRRAFTQKTVGFILTTLWQEAQARGALAGMTLSGTATQDAAGANWTNAETITREYELGADYLQVLQDLADAGLLDYRMAGRTLKLYRPDTVMATDRTVGNSQVHLTPLSVTEAPFRRTWEGLADFLHVRGDDDTSVDLTNPTGLKPWGRWEDYISQGGVSDQGTLTALGQRYQSLTAAERAEFTQALALGGDAPRPLLDFKPGDYIWSRTLAGALTRYRVRQVTLQKDGSTVQGNVVLNDRFLEADIRTRRTLDSLTGGASGGTSGGASTPTSPPGPDILQPANVASSPALSSLAYLDTAGAAQSQITVDWDDVSTNADGTPISDLGGYIIQAKPGAVNAGGEWREVTRTEAGTSITTLSPYAPESTWSFRVRAYDTSGNLSPAWSAANAITTARDTQGPVAPSQPTLKTRMGVIEYRWDGLSGTGGAMDADFFYVEVHASTVAGFTPTKGAAATLVDRLEGPGYGVMATPDYGVTWYVRLLPVDKSQNGGTPSQVASKTAQLITTTDVQPDSITTPLLRAGAVTAEKFSVGAMPISVFPNGNMEDQWRNADGTLADRPAGWRVVYSNGSAPMDPSWESGSPISGSRSMKVVHPNTDSSALIGHADAAFYPVSGGEAWHARARVRVTRNMPAGKVLLRFHTAKPPSDPWGIFDSNVNWATVSTPAMIAGQTYVLAFNTTVPEGHTRAAVSIGTEADSGGAWTLIVDNLEAFPAVTDANVTEVSATKLTTGTIQANQRVIAGNPVGARAEMNASGFQAYATDGFTKTFEVKASDGSVFTAGAFTTLASQGAGRVVISAIQNAYQNNQTWATIQFFPDNPNWDPALIWAAYGSGNPNFGVLSLVGPKLGTRTPARLTLRSEEQTNQTTLEMRANVISGSANQYLWGDANGTSVIHQMAYGGTDGSQIMSFRSPGEKRINFDYRTIGRNVIRSADESNTDIWMELVASTFMFRTSDATDNIRLGAAPGANNRPQFRLDSGDLAITYGGNGTIRATNAAGNTYKPMEASAFNVTSDGGPKTERTVVSGALDVLQALDVFDYSTPHGSPPLASKDAGKAYRQRGVIAQDVAALLPDAVHQDDVDGTGMKLDLYYLLATTMAGLQELAQEVATLKAANR